MTVKPVPDGFHTATPSVIVRDAAKAIDFYKKVFGAEEIMRMPNPDGLIMHAELKIGDSIIFLSDEIPGMGGKSPESVGTHTGGIYLYVPDVDDVFQRAIAAGGRPLAVSTRCSGEIGLGTLSIPSGIPGRSVRTWLT